MSTDQLKKRFGLNEDQKKNYYPEHEDLIQSYCSANVISEEQNHIVEGFIFYGILPGQTLEPQQSFKDFFNFIGKNQKNNSELCTLILNKLIIKLADQDKNHQHLKSFFAAVLCDLQASKDAWVWLGYLYNVNQKQVFEIYSNVVDRPGFSYKVFEPILDQAYGSISKLGFMKKSFAAHLVKNDLQFAQYALGRFAKSSAEVEKLSENVKSQAINRQAAEKFLTQQKKLQSSLGHVITKWAVAQAWIPDSVLGFFGISRESIKRTDEILTAIEEGLKANQQVQSSFLPTVEISIETYESEKQTKQSFKSVHNHDSESKDHSCGFLPKPDFSDEILSFIEEGRLKTLHLRSSSLVSTPIPKSVSLANTPESQEVASTPQTEMAETPFSGSFAGTPQSSSNLAVTPTSNEKKPKTENYNTSTPLRSHGRNDHADEKPTTTSIHFKTSGLEGDQVTSFTDIAPKQFVEAAEKLGIFGSKRKINKKTKKDFAQGSNSENSGPNQPSRMPPSYGTRG